MTIWCLRHLMDHSLVIHMTIRLTRRDEWLRLDCDPLIEPAPIFHNDRIHATAGPSSIQHYPLGDWLF